MTAILSLADLARHVAAHRAEGKKVVHARGTFDLLQRADIANLERARAAGHVLVVTVCEQDPTLGRPIILEAPLRAQTLASLPFVSAVALEGDKDAAACIALLGADVLASDLKPPPSGRPPPEDRPSQLHVLDAAARTEVVYQKREPFSPEAESFLTTFRQKYTATDVVRSLEVLKKLRVLVVGDTIVDEYHFCRPYGMPLKAPIIAAQFLDAESYLGGALAVANHVAGFCGQVHLVTTLGETQSREQFIRGGLQGNVDLKFFVRPGAPTTVKRRYLRKFLLQKLFEVAFFDDRPLPDEVDQSLADYLGSVAGSYDLVVVADFGHGCISSRSIEALTGKAKFLALNAQLNSINFGYHVITKYPRADYACIDEEETRMAMRDRTSPVTKLLPALADRLGAGVMTVTRGHHGSMTYRRQDRSTVSVPVLSRQVIDTIGAGDAYLSVTAPCVAAGLPDDLVGFIGNAVGALAVRIVGNKTSVGPEELFEFIHVLMR